MRFIDMHRGNPNVVMCVCTACASADLTAAVAVDILPPTLVKADTQHNSTPHENHHWRDGISKQHMRPPHRPSIHRDIHPS
mmetsp:Transcript_25195/g.62393  ORF Transcript_25195/g.62393 Transcript_25195/m.62393 type:complete len:81 (-) Transcript_25195:1170-1412(-)